MAANTIRPTAYSGGQKLLHWVIALMVLTLIPVGVYMKERGELTKFDAITNDLYTAHKTFGFIALFLIVLRIALRVSRGAPAPEATLTTMQRVASGAVHGLIYVLLLAVPLFGWVATAAYDARGLMGGFVLPAIVGKNEAWAEVLYRYHALAAFILGALVMVHIGAALYHRFILKDGVLPRMMP